MAIQYWWWLLAIALGIAELFTGSFYLVGEAKKYLAELEKKHASGHR